MIYMAFSTFQTIKTKYINFNFFGFIFKNITYLCAVK